MFYRLFAFLALISTLAAAPVEIVPPEFRGAVQPQVAVAPSGRMHIVFGKNDDIFHTTSSDGRAFSAPVKIGTLDKLALRMRRGPRVTATDNLVLVTAISHADGGLYSWTSGDAGQTWKKGAPLNTASQSAREGLHSLAGDGRGLVAAVWLDLRGQGTELWGRVSRDGGVTWAPDLPIYRSPDGHICECCVPNVAISPVGEIAAMWRNWLGGSRDLYLSTSRDGRTFSPAQKLGTGTWKLNGCPMDGGSLVVEPGGTWLSVWRRERTVFASDPGAPETQLAANAAQPVVAYAGKTRLTLWEAGGSLILQRDAGAPEKFAENASSASIAGGPETAIVTWEATVDGQKTILLAPVR